MNHNNKALNKSYLYIYKLYGLQEVVIEESEVDIVEKIKKSQGKGWKSSYSSRKDEEGRG